MKLRQKKNSTTPMHEVKESIAASLYSRKSLSRGEFLRYFALPMLITVIIAFTFLYFRTEKISLSFLPKSLFSGKHQSGITVRYDPYQLAQDIEKGGKDVTIIDVRSAQEYAKEHIRYAINVPIFTSEKHSASYTLMLKDFHSRVKRVKRGDTSVIFYGHTMYASYMADVLQLYSSGIALGVGWNEWRHFRNLWVPESSWNSFEQEKYIDGSESP